jgi:hypothetical protein
MFHERSGSNHHAKTMRASPQAVLMIHAVDEKIVTQTTERLEHSE